MEYLASLKLKTETEAEFHFMSSTEGNLDLKIGLVDVTCLEQND